ncbi:MAG: enoyl-CoA hydratase/isomerase family protein [Alphaproteobacteria bacterium]
MSEDSVLMRASPEGVATITLNRPEVHNAFNAEVIERLSDVLEDLAGADGVRAVLLEAVGKSFSAGADLHWMKLAASFTEAENLEDARALSQMLHRLNTLPKPTVALVQGAAFGGGVGLMAACDMVIAVKDAAFSLSEIKLGLIPATISPYVIAAIGERQAGRYFLTGERFDADEARRIGLVHEVVDDLDALKMAGERMVERLFAAPPGALADAKDLIAAVAGRPIDAVLIEDTARRIAARRSHAEAGEGIAAFLEKRKPGWHG